MRSWRFTFCWRPADPGLSRVPGRKRIAIAPVEQRRLDANERVPPWRAASRMPSTLGAAEQHRRSALAAN